MRKQLRRRLGTFCKYDVVLITTVTTVSLAFVVHGESMWTYVDMIIDICSLVIFHILLYPYMIKCDIIMIQCDEETHTHKKKKNMALVASPSWALPGQTWEEPRCSSKHEALLALTCVFCAYIWLDYEPYTNFAEMLPSKIGCCYQAFGFSCCD